MGQDSDIDPISNDSGNGDDTGGDPCGGQDAVETDAAPDDSAIDGGASEGSDPTTATDYSACAFGADSDASGGLPDSVTNSFGSSAWGAVKGVGLAAEDLTMAGYDGVRKLGVAFQEAWHGFTDDQMAEDQDRIHRYNLDSAEQWRLHNAKVDLGLTAPNDTWREEDPEETYGV